MPHFWLPLSAALLAVAGAALVDVTKQNRIPALLFANKPFLNNRMGILYYYRTSQGAAFL